MLFKVYYQESAKEVPVREHTKTVYVEGKNERDVRTKLKTRSINIEFVTAVEGDYLAYEQDHQDFKVLEIE
ncbi:DNA-dependent RNA polymerase subunit epsilon [Cytobacillus kochii]|uniref:DNA-dependent RNA polymerase subunit epsilon n=1 Tax=Cytobacillus kochii TaxID=859143 RepID=UPI00203A940B|nr:DNA-directed RNA polymerase subunit epsilon [Cytobacillus kochii]MCM3321881.1 DNA-directed RNA polymerase subunit epsilon [Cytobacillus kochii]MCM3343285.1 DNA-directed RNA polymerase subunit epsilon [Cytobacillus kochii]